MKISDVVAYLYAQTSRQIFELKRDTYRSTTDEKYAYRAPDGNAFRNKRPPQELMDAGWRFTKVKFERVESCISPRHARWREYRYLKHRATLLLAARLLLKANRGVVPAKEEIGPYLVTGILRPHARTSSAQKTLAYRAYRYLRKLENRLLHQPGRFVTADTWLREREVRHE